MAGLLAGLAAFWALAFGLRPTARWAGRRRSMMAHDEGKR